MRDTIIFSGCSLTDPDFTHNDPTYKRDYKMWPIVFNELLGNKYKIVNKAKGGAGNQFIYQSILEGINEVGEDRVKAIIPLWSGFDRTSVHGTTIKLNNMYEALSYVETQHLINRLNKDDFIPDSLDTNSNLRIVSEAERQDIKDLTNLEKHNRLTISYLRASNFKKLDNIDIYSKTWSGHTMAFQLYTSFRVSEEQKQHQMLLIKEKRWSEFLNFKMDTILACWEKMGLGSSIMVAINEIFTDKGIDIIISESLNYQYSLKHIANSIGANYFCGQGIHPFSPWELARLSQLGAIRGNHKRKEQDYWNKIFTKAMLTKFDGTPRKSTFNMEKDKKLFKGFPYFRHMNGGCIQDVIMERNLYISTHDAHPNEEGNKFIAEYMYRGYLDVYNEN